MDEIHIKAKEIFSRMPVAWQTDHNSAWKRIENLVTSLMPKKSKVFEVHHAIVHARRLYLVEVANGMCAFDAERRVRAAYSESK